MYFNMTNRPFLNGLSSGLGQQQSCKVQMLLGSMELVDLSGMQVGLLFRYVRAKFSSLEYAGGATIQVCQS